MGKPALKPRRIFMRGGHVAFRDGPPDVITVPAVRDFGPSIFADVYYTQEDVQAMFLARRSLTAVAMRALDDGVLDDLDRERTAPLRGTGLGPEERAILGAPIDRALAVRRSRSVILEYQASPQKPQKPLADYDIPEYQASLEKRLADYDEVSAHACREGSRACLLSRDRARAAHILAAREHEALVRRESMDASRRSSTARATRRESSARPKRSIIAPDGAPAAPRGLGDLIRNDTFNNLVALARRESLPRNSASPQ